MSRETKGGGGEDVKASREEKQKGGMTQKTTGGFNVVEMVVDGESAVTRQCWRREA